MKRSFSLLIAFLVVAAAAGAQQESAERRGEGPRGERERRGGPGHQQKRARPAWDHFKALDKDGDGAVSFAEFANRERMAGLTEEGKQGLFAKMDRNGDGMIRADDLSGIQIRPPGEMDPLRKLDADKNGKLSFAEFRANPWLKKVPDEKAREMFARFDRNNDDFIDRDEMRRPGMRPPFVDRSQIEKLDENKDGSLSFEEWSKHPRFKERAEDEAKLREMFDRMDRNDDGKLNPEDRPDWMRRGPRPDGERNGEGRRGPHPEGGRDRERPRESGDEPPRRPRKPEGPAEKPDA